MTKRRRLTPSRNVQTPEPATMRVEAKGARNENVGIASLEFDVANIANSPAKLNRFVASALRTKVWDARRVLAHGLDPTLSFEELISEVRSADPQSVADRALSRRSESVPAKSIDLWWRALGKVVALQNGDPGDIADGLALHEVARRLSPVREWPSGAALTYAQLLWFSPSRRLLLRDDDELLATLNAEDRSSLSADLARHSEGVGSTVWQTALARMLAPVAAVTTAAGAITPFDGLRADVQPDTVEGPLVSVIMSAYRPGMEILTSVRSVLDQSWSNIELLVVDDASGPEYSHVFERVVTLDDRVRVLTQPQNRGTYAARNRALPEARGEFVTFQDSDDWSHPERIERQVKHLLGDRTLPAVMSRSVRCTADLELQLLGYRSTRPNVSSLMMRRSTLEALGEFDSVRKGADSEYEMRIAAYYGRRVPVMPELLAFVRLDPSSLSRSDFRPGWWHPARFAYRDGYRHWHRKIELGEPPVHAQHGRTRSFPAPRTFLRETGVPLDGHAFDVLFVADWREMGGAQSALLQGARVAAAQGSRVGIMQLESLRALAFASDGLCAEVSVLEADGTVVRVLPDETVSTSRLVLGDPSLLSYPRGDMSHFRVEEVILFAPTGPADPASGAELYSPETVRSRVQQMWGVIPTWLPSSGLVRSALAGAGSVQMFDKDYAGCVLPASVVPPVDRSHDRPIVGAIVGVAEDGEPAPADVSRQLFPLDARFDVRMISSPDRIAKAIGPVRPEWLIFRPGEATEHQLFRQVHFFVSTAGPARPDLVVPRVIGAASAGAIAVVSPSYRDVLGDAAVYANPTDAVNLIERLFMDPAELRLTIARAQSTIERNFSRASSLVSQFGLAPREGRTHA